MKIIISLITILCFISCSSIDVKRQNKLVLQQLFYAEVVGKESISLASNESMTGRVLIGLISAGLVGAIATANTEPGLSSSVAWRYDLIIDGETKIRKINSFSDVKIDSWVKVIKASGTSMLLLSEAE